MMPPQDLVQAAQVLSFFQILCSLLCLTYANKKYAGVLPGRYVKKQNKEAFEQMTKWRKKYSVVAITQTQTQTQR